MWFIAEGLQEFIKAFEFFPWLLLQGKVGTMKHNINCRFCNTGHYEAKDTSDSPSLNNLFLGLGWRGEDEPWTVLECGVCGNVQVFRGPKQWWNGKI